MQYNIQTSEKKGPRFWKAWLRLTAYPHGYATPVERDRSRRASWISAFASLATLLALLNTPAVIGMNNMQSLFSTLFPVVLLIGALVLNRVGLLAGAGLCCVICVLVADTSPILLGGEQGLTLVPSYCFLALGTALAGCLLPAPMVLVVGLINSLITCGGLLLLPKDAQLTQQITGNIAIMLFPIIIFHVITAVLIFLIIRSLTDITKSADKAQDIIALQRGQLELQQRAEEEKQILQEGVDAFAQTFAQVANGNEQARVITGDGKHVLWQLAIPLNNMLNRYQQVQRELAKAQQMNAMLQQRLEQVQKAQNRMFQGPNSGVPQNGPGFSYPQGLERPGFPQRKGE